MSIDEIIDKLSGNREKDFKYLVKMIEKYPEHAKELGKLCYELQSEKAKAFSDSIDWRLEMKILNDKEELEELIENKQFVEAHHLREDMLMYLIEANLDKNLIDCYNKKEILFAKMFLNGIKNIPTTGNVSQIIKDEINYLTYNSRYEVAKELATLLIYFAPLNKDSYEICFYVYKKLNDKNSISQLIDNYLNVCVTCDDFILYYQMLDYLKPDDKNEKIINHLKFSKEYKSFKPLITKQCKEILYVLAEDDNKYKVDLSVLIR